MGKGGGEMTSPSSPTVASAEFKGAMTSMEQIAAEIGQIAKEVAEL